MHPQKLIKKNNLIRFFSNPFTIIIISAFLLNLPYLFFFEYSPFLISRLINGAFSAVALVATSLLLSRKIASISIFFTVLIYSFAAICETGNYLIKGESFSVEFWQFISDNSIIFAFQLAPLLSCLAIFLLITIGLTHFFLLSYANLSKQFNSPIFVLIFTIPIITTAIYSNYHYSPIAKLFNSYRSYKGMKKKVENAQYLRVIPSRKEIFAKPGKNILHIILESVGDIYTDLNRFPKLAEGLSQYKQNGVTALNMVQTPNQANSYMGHFVTEHGRYYFVPPKSPDVDTSLGYILKQAGYQNIFIRGAAPDTAGPFQNLYSKKNGYDLFISSNDFKEKYSKDFASGLGYSDEVIFEEALTLYQQLIKDDTPFKLTLFTLDTHGFLQGVSPTCKEKYQYNGPFEQDEMVQAVHCTDKLLTAFIEKIYSLPQNENLITVIHSDHVQHTVTPAISPDSQKLYAIIMGKDIKPFKQIQETHLMDIAPTILSLANIETNAVFLAGDDFSKDLTRQPILDQDVSTDSFSDKHTKNLFYPIQTLPLEEIEKKNRFYYEDKNISITFAKFNGATYQSLYFYINNKSTHTPLFTLYSLEKKIPKFFKPRRGFLLDRKQNTYVTGIVTGGQSRWKNLLLEDLATGSRWKINIAEQSITPILTNKKTIRNIEKSKKEVFSMEQNFSFKALHRVIAKKKNLYEIQERDGQAYFEMSLSSRKNHLVEIEISSQNKDIAKIYYEINKTPFSEMNSNSAFLEPGNNHIRFFLPRGKYGDLFRFDMGEKKGEFKITSFKVFTL